MDFALASAKGVELFGVGNFEIQECNAGAIPVATPLGTVIFLPQYTYCPVPKQSK